MADENSDILTEVKEGFKNLIYDRFSSPLIGSIVLSWVLLNYQFFVILFCSTAVERKIELLNNYFIEHHIFFVWFLPIIYGLIYTFAYPFLHIRVMRFVLKRKRLELIDKQESERNSRFTHEDMQFLINRHIKELDEFRNENNSLKLELDQLRKIDSSPETRTPESIAASLTEIQTKIVIVLGGMQNAGNKNGASEKKLSEMTGFSLMFVGDAIGDLIQDGVVTGRISGDSTFLLTPIGVKIYIYIIAENS